MSWVPNEAYYMLAIVAFTWLILRFCFKGHPKNRIAQAVCLCVGVGLAIPMGIFLEVDWFKMLGAYALAPMVYKSIVKWIMKKIGHNYGGKICNDQYSNKS